MKPLCSPQALLATLLAGSALNACGAEVAGPHPIVPFPDRIATSVARWAGAPHPDRRPSWFSPRLAAQKSPVLFVSDGDTESVYIYDLSTFAVLATVTGLSQPQGECTGNNGNVWITDTSAKEIYEVSHQGRLENELGDSLGYPVACAWDKKTSRLAVMNIFGLSESQGAVVIYKNGSGSPTPYDNPQQYYYDFGGFDTEGNLFLDGRDANGGFVLSVLQKGATSATTITIAGGSLYFPGMVQWDSSTARVIVGDQACNGGYTSCLYEMKVAKGAATIVTTTTLQNSAGSLVCDLVQGVFFKGHLLGSDYDFCGSLPSTTYSWPYPAGGMPTLSNSSVDETPVGAAVSP